MGNFKDYSKTKIGCLKITSRHYKDGDKHVLWNYECDCGKIGTIRGEVLRDDITCFHKEDVIGNKYNRWTVLEELEKKNGQRMVLCECSCENKTRRIVYLNNLRYNKSLSCGCLPLEKNTTHGMSNDRLYTIHKGILARCNNKNHRDYHNYGARGIVVCDEWKKNFMSFYNWAIENGYEDNLTLERVNVDGNYEPSNCTWITIEKQQLNKRNTIYVEHDGEKERLSDLSRRINVSYKTLQYRMEQNYKYEDLIKPAIYNRKE